jgi:hypothetical protein
MSKNCEKLKILNQKYVMAHEVGTPTIDGDADFKEKSLKSQRCINRKRTSKQ